MKTHMTTLARMTLACVVGLVSCAAHAERDKPPLPAEELSLHPTAQASWVGRSDPCVLAIRVSTRREVTPAWFLVDTGSTVTIFSKSFEPSLGRRVGRRQLATPFSLSGRASELANEYSAPTLYLGNVSLKTGPTVLTSDNTRKASGCEGTLGMDCLIHYCIQFDFPAGKMRFLDSDGLKREGLGRAFPIKCGGMPLVSMNVFDGRKLRFVLDTGFYQPAAGTLPPTLIRTALLNHATKDSTSGIFSFEAIDFGGETYSGLSFASTQVGDEGVDGFLGLPFLARHVVTLDFPNQTMYLKRRDGAGGRQEGSRR